MTGQTGIDEGRPRGPRERLREVGVGALSDQELLSPAPGHRGPERAGRRPGRAHAEGGRRARGALAARAWATSPASPASAAPRRGGWSPPSSSAGGCSAAPSTAAGPSARAATWWPPSPPATSRPSGSTCWRSRWTRRIDPWPSSTSPSAGSRPAPLRPATSSAPCSGRPPRPPSWSTTTPSGEPEPSPSDLDFTERLVEAGELLGIPVLDHIILGRDRFFSFLDAGILKEDPVSGGALLLLLGGLLPGSTSAPRAAAGLPRGGARRADDRLLSAPERPPRGAPGEGRRRPSTTVRAPSGEEARSA